MADAPLSRQLSLSRDETRAKIIEFMQQYMELENVDLTKGSFLSFVTDIMSTLSSNLMFYQSSIYKEFFLTKAQLPESIHNLSTFVGYSPQEASYAIANLLLTVPLTFTDSDTTFTIPDGFKFTTSDNVTFITYYETTVNVTNNEVVDISAVQDGKHFNIPVSVDSTSEMVFNFVLPVRQYKIVEQEFQVSEDLQPFQFSTIDVPTTGKVSGLVVNIKDPDSESQTTYTEFDSLYLMGSDDYGYVLRNSLEGKKIYFGNGIIGVQPLPGSTVLVEINETEGVDGNVISGSISTGERIYALQNGISTVLSYTVTNTSPAYNGEDQQSLQEIRTNSINSLTALHRLVTENDYAVADSVIENSPLAQHSIPVLKRSDVKVNEIQLFTSIQFGNDIVPTRNAFYTFPVGTTNIESGTILTIDGDNYITIFDMNISVLNTAAFYHYMVRELSLTPTLLESWGQIYNFNMNSLEVTSDSTSNVLFEATYYSTESDYSNITCSLIINEDTYNMTNVPGSNGGSFEYTFTDLDLIPDGLFTSYFLFSNTNLSPERIHRYSTTLTVKQDLMQFMLSNAAIDSTSIIVYDIPVIEKDYYDSIDQIAFELQVMQTFLSSLDFNNYRMLTDFANVKFCNTTGQMKAMLRNSTTKTDVKDIYINTVPVAPALSDRYIVSGNEGTEWNGYRDYISQCTNIAPSVTWTFTAPQTNDVVYATDKDKKYVYGEQGWIEPIYEIPIRIEIELFRTLDSALSDSILIDNIKEALIDTFESRFGPNAEIHRSEIIDVIHNITGVSYCRLIKPETSIFFKFNIDNFDQEELLEYSPDLVYFTEDDIVINVITNTTG